MSSHNYCESLSSITFLHFKITMCCLYDFPNLHYIITLSRKGKAISDENRHRCLQFGYLMARVVLMSSCSFFSLLSIVLPLAGFEAYFDFTFSI